MHPRRTNNFGERIGESAIVEESSGKTRREEKWRAMRHDARDYGTAHDLVSATHRIFCHISWMDGEESPKLGSLCRGMFPTGPRLWHMGSAKTANADRSATLTNNPPPIPSFSLTSRLYVPCQFATFLGTGYRNSADQSKQTWWNYSRCSEFRFFFPLSRWLLSSQLQHSNKVARISNYEETFNRLNDPRRDNYFPTVGTFPWSYLSRGANHFSTISQ